MMDNTMGFIPKIWGKSGWTFLETICYNYPETPTEQDKKDHYNLFMLLVKVLPCHTCREAYQKNIQDPDTLLNMDVLQSRETLTKWFYNLRNKVNQTQDVIYKVSYDDVKQKYARYRIKCSDTGCNRRNFEVSNYRDLYISDFSILNYDLAKRFTEYAIKRGVPEEDIKLLDIYYEALQNNNKILILRRNEECTKILNDMILNNIRVIDNDGKPTMHELRLIMRLNSNISKDVLENMFNDAHSTRYRLKK